MTEVIEETHAEEKAQSAVAKAALVGMSMMGSSVAHTEPHADHGYAPARWTASAISIIGFLIGGIAFPFGIWALVVVGGVLQVVAVIANLAMNAAGMGAKANDRWAAAKAQAAEARSAA
ncbi:MAG TPA: HGxxPAAW family protein [Actinospica sp.]|nr:HGxxPAAW family protein [Actinospica sp.]